MFEKFVSNHTQELCCLTRIFINPKNNCMKVLSKFGMAILVIFMAQQFAFAQDIIYKKGGEKLEVKVKEIGLDEVKYARWEDQDGILYSIAKETILKIKLEKDRK